ncbi:MAG: DUF2125 domain-containing protein [Xanthobacteraceae bacterium]
MLSACVIIVLAGGWCWLWYYAASEADRTLSGWVQREAAAGRVYSCGSQDITGFPFRIQAHCVEAGAQINSNQPPFTVNAKDITFAAQVYHPTRLVASVTGPLTLSIPGQPPSFTANWTRAQMTVSGLPPEPESVTVSVDDPKIDQSVNAITTTIFTAGSADVQSRIIGGTAANNPVIDTLVRFAAATAPTVHPLLAGPVQGDINAVFKGFKDLAPKPWAQRFREMQAAGGSIEIKRLRLERKDSIIVGEGELTLNPDGKVEGLIRVAISGVENIVPQLGIDRAISRGIGRLSGDKDTSQGLNMLDQLMPGLGGAIRSTATASVIDSLNKMGQPTAIDNKPAIMLPLRFSDGSAYLGMIPLGDVPPLF